MTKGLASYCKAETTFTFHFPILTLSSAFLSINNREMKSESGFSFAMASQPFWEKSLLVFKIWFICRCFAETINFFVNQVYWTTWPFPLFILLTIFSMKKRIEAGDIHSRACMPETIEPQYIANSLYFFFIWMIIQ